MADWGTNPVKKVNLNKEDYHKLIQSIQTIGRDRKKAQGDLDEADFFCGAMAVLDRLGIDPPVWPILIMSGRSIVDFDPDKKEGKE